MSEKPRESLPNTTTDSQETTQKNTTVEPQETTQKNTTVEPQETTQKKPTLESQEAAQKNPTLESQETTQKNTTVEPQESSHKNTTSESQSQLSSTNNNNPALSEQSSSNIPGPSQQISSNTPPSLNIRFDGKRALVTGARGIARDVTLQLASAGAEVVIVARTLTDLQNLNSEVNSLYPDKCKFIQADVGSIEECKKIIEQAGPIDLLVNNAAIAQVCPFLETKIEDWDNIINVNVRGPLLLSQGVAKAIIQRKSKGSIVNVSSQASKVALWDHTAYGVSKSALDQLTRAMALELGPHGIRVNAVNPTVVLTEMGKVGWSSKEKSEPHLKRIPLGKFCEPHEVASVICFLLSDLASMINGETVVIDGGFLASALPK